MSTIVIDHHFVSVNKCSGRRTRYDSPPLASRCAAGSRIAFAGAHLSGATTRFDPSFRGASKEANPESRDSGFALARPGMTNSVPQLKPLEPFQLFLDPALQVLARIALRG